MSGLADGGFRGCRGSCAIAPISMNVSGPMVMSSLRWAPPAVVRVAFLDGQRELQSRTAAAAREWQSFTALRFDFVEDRAAEVRVTFAEGEGVWSRVGREALSVAPPAPTVGLGVLSVNTSDEVFNAIVWHEFGHVLGFQHEHQRQDAPIRWSRPHVYDHYMGAMGYAREEVDRYVIDKVPIDAAQASPYDSHSIMHYEVPAMVTEDGFAVPWNTSLSNDDKDRARQMYP